MADFRKALDLLFELEGLEADIRGDPGGETYRGIARNYWDDWPGWSVVDAARGRALTAAERSMLEQLAEDLYRRRYWVPLRGDRIPSDAVAAELLEQSVHTTSARAIDHLQQALNKCNDDARKWPEVEVDGAIGPQTLSALARACSRRDWEVAVVKDMNVLQATYLRSRVGRENVYAGWLRRISLPWYD